MQRTVWIKAYYGIHREVIANELGISIGAVEQIIQSHEGLSNWRHHLLMTRRMMVRQKKLLAFYTQKNPETILKTLWGLYVAL